MNSSMSFLLIGLYLTILGSKPTFADVVARDYSCNSGDICFQNTLQLDARSYALTNSTLYRFWGFRVYSAALYTEAGKLEEGQFWSQPLTLQLQYHRSIDKEDFLTSARKILNKNPNWNSEELDPVLVQFSDYIVNVSEGDSFTLRYLPTKGSLALYYGNSSSPATYAFLGEVVNDEFAKAYLGMWIGNYPVKDKQRDLLLSVRDE